MSGFSLPSVDSVCSFFFVIAAGGVEVLASSFGGYFVLSGASFDGVYLEVGGWLAKRGGGCFARGTLLGIWCNEPMRRSCVSVECFEILLWKRGRKRVVEVGEMEMMEPSVIFDGLILASRFILPGGFFLFAIAS